MLIYANKFIPELLELEIRQEDRKVLVHGAKTLNDKQNEE